MASTTSSGGPTGSAASPTPSSMSGPNTAAPSEAKSRCKTTETGSPTATSRSRCCHEGCDHPTLGHDVPAVLHLGRVVHDDRRVHDQPGHGNPHSLAVHGEPRGGHR